MVGRAPLPAPLYSHVLEGAPGETSHPCSQWPPLRRVLAELFQLQGWDSDPRAAILLDLYFYTVQFSREHSFTREQSSVFFAIVKDTHEACVETPLPNVEECYRYFTELLFCHAVRVSPAHGPGRAPGCCQLPHGRPLPISCLTLSSPPHPQRPPFSIDLFSQEQLALMSDYVVNTYFRHFKLYKYAFTPQVWRLFLLGGTSPAPAPGWGSWLAALFTPLSSAGPRDPLREYISAQLCQELAQLRLAVEERLRASEEQFNAKLALLEKVPNSPKGGGRGHRK
uniref:Cilia and flagella associated protein 119 n=1 Tax=Terrapene triunguis TaxID=2587831 RepID=A0A674IZQ0_9SAUR